MPKIDLPRALVLSAKRYNDTSFILNIFSKEHGRYQGIFKGKSPPQPGTFIQGRWQARLSEQFGTLYIEPLNAFAIQFLDDKKRLATIASLCYLLEKTIPERQAYPFLYDQTELFLNHLSDLDFIKNYAHWELDLLTTLGFGLDLKTCAGACGLRDLTYVSPKTGRAVCASCGNEYRDRLFILPSFLILENTPTNADLRSALNLTGFFITKHFNITLPPTRGQIL